MAFIGIDHFVAVMRLGAITGIGAAGGLDHLIAVQAVFIELRSEDQVAVLIRTGMIDEIGVFVIDDIER